MLTVQIAKFDLIVLRSNPVHQYVADLDLLLNTSSLECMFDASIHGRYLVSWELLNTYRGVNPCNSCGAKKGLTSHLFDY